MKYIFFLIIPIILFGFIQSADALTYRIPGNIDSALTESIGNCPTTFSISHLGISDNFSITRQTSGAPGHCQLPALTFDASSLPAGVTVTDTVLSYTVSSVTNAANCDYVSVSVDPQTTDGTSLYNAIVAGSVYVNNDSTCTTAGAKTEDLGTTADADINSAIDSGGEFRMGLKYDNMSNDGIDHSAFFTTPVLVLTYTYTVPDPPTLPAATQTTVTWGTPEGNGAAPDKVIFEYLDESDNWRTLNYYNVATGTVTWSNGNPLLYPLLTVNSNPSIYLSVNNTNGLSQRQQVFNSTIVSNLKSYWPLQSTTNDNGIENNDGTVTGTEIYSPVGQYFDGSSYDTIGNETDYDYERTNSFSVCFTGQWTGSGNMVLISKRDATAPNSGWEIQQIAGPLLQFHLANTITTNALVMLSPAGYNDGIEHRICWTYAGTSLPSGVKLYADNSEVGLTTSVNNLSASILNNKSLYLGTRDAGTAKFTGSLGDVMIVNQVMDAHQIDEDYQNYIDHLVRPQNVTDLEINSIGLSNAILNWTAPTTYEETLLGYQINYTTPYGSPSTIIANNTGDSDTTYTVTGLAGATPYSFRVQAWSSGGNSYGAGNIANDTTLGNDYTIGNLTTPIATNPDSTPFHWTRTEVNGTTTLLALTYPTSYTPDVLIESQFGNMNTTYTNLNGTDQGDGTTVALFYFVNQTNDLITATASDSGSGDSSTYQLTWTQFPLLDQLTNFRNGTYGTEGMFGAVDLITLGVIILSMIGFNRVNAAAGAIFSIIIIGSLSYFQIISWPSTIAAGLAALVLLAVSSHHREES